MSTLEERILNQYAPDDPDLDPAETMRRKILSKYGALPKDAPKYTPLPPEEAAGLKDKLLGIGGSALGFIGGTIDKLGFRQARALASGHLEDIPRSLIPFGGTLGLDDQSHNLNWDDILTGKGRILPQVIKENDPTSWEARDFAGPILDTLVGPKIPKILPTTFLGKLAAKFDNMPRTVSQAARGMDDLEPNLWTRTAESATPLPRPIWGGAANPGLVSDRVREGLHGIEGTAEAYGSHPLNHTVARVPFIDAAKAAGYEPESLLGAPLRSGIELGIPGMKPWQFDFGNRAGTQRVADFMSHAADKMQFTRDIPLPGGRSIRNPLPLVRNLFDAGTGNSLEPEIQRSNIMRNVPGREAIQQRALAEQHQMNASLNDVFRNGGLDGAEAHVNNFIRDRAERLPLADDMAQWAASRMPGADPAHVAGMAAQQPGMVAIGDRLRAQMDWIKSESQRLGLPFAELQDEYVDYLMRRTPMSGNQSWQQAMVGRIWNGLTGSNIQRMKPLQNNPMGTTGVNVLSVDPNVSGPDALLRGQDAQDYITRMQTPEALLAFRRNMPASELIGMHLPNFDYDQLRGLAGDINRPGMLSALESRSSDYARSGMLGMKPAGMQSSIVQTARPTDLAPFFRIMPHSNADLLASLSDVEPNVNRLLGKALAKPYVQGGPHMNELLDLARLADPAGARALAGQGSVIAARQQVPGMIAGMTVSSPSGLKRYADILSHGRVAPLLDPAFAGVNRQARLTNAFDVSSKGLRRGHLEQLLGQTTQGQPSNVLFNLLGRHDPLELAYVKDTLAQRLRPAMARGVRYGDEAAIRSRIDPAALAADFAGSPELKAMEAQAKPLVGFLRNLDPSHVLENKPLFENDPIAAGTSRFGDRFGKGYGANRAAMDVVRRFGAPIEDLGAKSEYMTAEQFARSINAKAHAVPRPFSPAELAQLSTSGINSAEELRTLMEQVDLGNPLAIRRAMTIPQALKDASYQAHYSGSDAELLSALAPHGFYEPSVGGVPGSQYRYTARDIIEGTGPPNAEGNQHTAHDMLSQFGIPNRYAQAALENQANWIVPHEIRPFQDKWDQLQQVYKAMLYPIWPASQLRNYMGGGYNNWTHDAFDPRFSSWNPKRYLQPQADMANLLRGIDFPLPERYAALGPDAGRLKLIEDLASHRIAFQDGMFSEMGDASKATNPGQLAHLQDPNRVPAPLGRSLMAPFRRAAAPYLDMMRFKAPSGGWDQVKPWAINGVGGRTEDVNSLVKAARGVGDVSENMLRGGQGIALLRQGFDPAVVGRMVRQAHFDYRDLAPFEKNFLRKFLPFYTFSRKNLPEQVRMLATNPEKTARTIQGMQSIRDGQYVPEFLGGGFAVPLGQEENGKQRFLSQTGLPIEEAFEKIKLDYSHGIPLPDVRKTAMEYMGLVNPAIKGPLEQMLGYQFFTGRRLDELHPTGLGTLGGYLEGENAQVTSQLLANTPASRFISTADKLLDSRKTGVAGLIAKLMNVGTGFKISDVDLDHSRSMDVRKALEAMMHKDPSISNFMEAYVPASKFADVQANRPETMRLMRLFTQMKIEARKKAKEKREQEHLLGVR